MANLTLRNLPESTLAGLRDRAAANHRSVNGELLAIIDFVVAHPEKVSVDDYLWTDPIAAQKRDILAAAGIEVNLTTRANLSHIVKGHRWRSVASEYFDFGDNNIVDSEQ